jgi:hypothetical protein
MAASSWDAFETVTALAKIGDSNNITRERVQIIGNFLNMVRFPSFFAGFLDLLRVLNLSNYHAKNTGKVGSSKDPQ